MLQWLFLAAIVALGLSEPAAKPKAEPYDYDDFEEYHKRPIDPHVARSLDSMKEATGSHSALQNKIIDEVHSPDYYEQSYILDYRYLKTGGRDYSIADGGQILILPKGIHSDVNKEFRNYDELLDHLRWKKAKKSDSHRPEGLRKLHYKHDDHYHKPPIHHKKQEDEEYGWFKD